MSKASIQLSDHFTVIRLLKFTLPSIIMMIFTSIYSVVDGFFVSNYVGKTSFAAVNFIMPILMILGTLGFMIGTGGSALVAKTLGEGNREKANRIFSFLVYFSTISGIVLAILGFVLIRPLSAIMGAEGQMLDDCVKYGRIILIALPAFILQMAFQSFFVAAEKPDLGLYVSIACGVTNMVLDALLVAVFGFGLVGAAVATTVSEILGGVIPFIYFGRKNSSLLKLGKAEFDKRALIRTCTNGSSELMSNISSSIVGMLYNMQLMKYAGEDGVAAYGVLMYVNLVFCAAFIGYDFCLLCIYKNIQNSADYDKNPEVRKIRDFRIYFYCHFILYLMKKLKKQQKASDYFRISFSGKASFRINPHILSMYDKV